MNFLIKHFEMAWENRAPLREEFFRTQTTCCRLFCGADEGAPGIVVEQYGPVLLVQIWPDDFGFSDDDLEEACTWLMGQTRAQSVYRKVFEKDRSARPAGEANYDDKPYLGTPSPVAITVQENGVRYEVHPFSGFMTGLFMDQRENRVELAQLAKGKKLLNLFSYSCSFSVAAAVHGAAGTVNVDLSKKYLDLGRRNFELNGLALDSHRFFADDSREFLRRQQKRDEKFDVVVIDPPSFSRNGKKVFRLEEEAEDMLFVAGRTVASGGHLFFSCNLSKWDESDFLAVVRDGLPEKDWERLPKIKKPVDFAADRLMKSILLKRRT